MGKGMGKGIGDGEEGWLAQTSKLTFNPIKTRIVNSHPPSLPHPHRGRG